MSLMFRAHCACMMHAGWVAHFDEEVRGGSATYAAMYHLEGYERDNPYQNHPLLPYNILTRLPPSSTKAKPLRLCHGCRRELDPACFKKQRGHLCYVCGC